MRPITDNMKTAIAQLNIKNGQLSLNFQKIRLLVDEAKKQQAELIVFPALSISGLCVGDRWLEEDFNSSIEHYNDELVKLADGIDILFGSIHRQHGVGLSDNPSGTQPVAHPLDVGHERPVGGDGGRCHYGHRHCFVGR